MLAVAITAIIAGGITMTFFQVVNGSARANNHLTAVNQVQSAGHWFSRDAQMAQGEPVIVYEGPLFKSITLNWTDRDGKEHEVIYTLELHGQPWKLKRSYSIDGGVPSEVIVAQHIVPAPPKTNCVWDGAVLTFTVTASVGEEPGEQSETRVYKVSPRPQESPQQRQLLTNEEATQPTICITRWCAQTFTSGVTDDLAEVILMLRRATYFVDPGTVILEITECDAEGKPQRTPGEPDDKSDVLGTATIELPASGEWEICTFENFTDADGEPVTVSLTKDTKYAVVAYTLGLFMEDSCQVMLGPGDSDPYAGGTSFLWNSTKPKIWEPYRISMWYIDFHFDTFAGEKHTISARIQQ